MFTSVLAIIFFLRRWIVSARNAKQSETEGNVEKIEQESERKVAGLLMLPRLAESLAMVSQYKLEHSGPAKQVREA